MNATICIMSAPGICDQSHAKATLSAATLALPVWMPVLALGVLLLVWHAWQRACTS
jgi:Ni,Fe-hydrogenase I large subunit